MSTSIKSLPQQHGEPLPPQQHHHRQHHRHIIPPVKGHGDYSVPIKPPSEHSGSAGKSLRFDDAASGGSSGGRYGSPSSRYNSPSSIASSSGSGGGRSGSPGQKGVLRIGKITKSLTAAGGAATGSVGASPLASQSADSGLSSNYAVTSGILSTSTGGSGSGAGMSGNLLADAASVDSLERRFQKLIKDGTPNSSSIAGMAAVLSGDSDGGGRAGDDGGGGGGGSDSVAGGPDESVLESIMDAPDDSIVEREEEVVVPLKKVPIQQKQQQMKQQIPVEEKPRDKIQNPFGRPLPR